ncbi:2Fe-2S iron-sulfur cluster-binding protein [Zavarzinia compransoris]|uniref:Monooxygenase n=1 Tax=Zavarzinia compransoris TaxID=1264899 RepID=A0A317E3L4_9PROT|nr:2Fe-2S iron-sulfur cluster binding domain-containing protein [Zavarzinia compransoris]PWR20974.1 monooxygenase [Zavarzinia compransoris]TDP44003.1 p-cymene monooxygenase electron transfer component [Zavarzinia compransoris]
MASLLKKLFGRGEPRVATINPLGVQITVDGSQTLLEAALAQGIAFPHSCTVGTCGSCKCRLTEGRVSAITDFGYTLSRQELEAGYILACQAQVKGAITIEIENPGADLPAPEVFAGRIIRTDDLTHDIKAVTLGLDRPIDFVAGQYADITAPGLPARSYSFATAPERGGRQEISFFIRKVPGGQFTEKLFAGALAGAEVSVSGPHGTFHLRPGEAPIVCIAGGSGLAPLLSLLQHARKNRVRRRCVMLFGARTQADLYKVEQIEEIARDWLPSLRFVPVLSHEPAESGWAGLRGLVTDHIAATLPEGDRAEFQGYMCGPPGMIDAAIAELTRLGVPLPAIHYDKFTDAGTGKR